MPPPDDNDPRPSEPLLGCGIESAPVHVRAYRAGDWSVVQIDGELDIAGVRAVPPLTPGEDVLVVFDLRGTSFMDCRGLRMIVGAARAADAKGGCVRVAGASRQVSRFFSLVDLNGTFSMFDSLQDAVTVPRSRPSAGEPPGA